MIPNPSELLTATDVVTLGSGPVLAVAHGAGGGVEANFALLADHLPARLTGPNYPGSGATPPAAGPLSLDVLADQVIAAGLAAGAEQFPVLGLSLGAAVAVTAAVRHPEHVSALVLTVGVARADAQSRSFAAAWRALDAAGDLAALSRLLLLTVGTADLLAAVDDDVAAADIAAGYPPGGAAHAELVSRVDVTGLLPQVAVPTLVVVAGADRIVLPATARSFVGIAGAEVVEYDAAGHIFTAAETRRWAIDVAAFLERSLR